MGWLAEAAGVSDADLASDDTAIRRVICARMRLVARGVAACASVTIEEYLGLSPLERAVLERAVADARGWRRRQTRREGEDEVLIEAAAITRHIGRILEGEV